LTYAQNKSSFSGIVAWHFAGQIIWVRDRKNDYPAQITDIYTMSRCRAEAGYLAGISQHIGRSVVGGIFD